MAERSNLTIIPIMTKIIYWFVLCALPSLSLAGQRISADYSITTDTADAGGRHSASNSYTNDGSVGGTATGLSAATSFNEKLKIGYIGQLYDVFALQLIATPSTIDESGTRQLAASTLLDDATSLSLSPSAVSWSVRSGPLTSINSSGLTTAATVAQDTEAQVQGSYAGLTGTMSLIVLDTIPDNYGRYAGDGLPDTWQTQYFGTDNLLAAPNAISDGSGLTNFFKFTAGLIPNNSASTFLINAQPIKNEPGKKTISFGPTFPDRQYTLLFSTNLSTWSILNGPVAGNNGTAFFTDNNAIEGQKFYRIEISKP